MGLCLFWAGCAQALGQHTERQARRELACPSRPLIVQDLGSLVPYVGDQRTVRVFEVRGCDQQHTYFCAETPWGPCSRDPGRLWPNRDGSAIARALRIRRTISRARCPSDHVQLIRESASLYRYQSCDGGFQVHCTSNRCQRVAALP